MEIVQNISDKEMMLHELYNISHICGPLCMYVCQYGSNISDMIERFEIKFLNIDMLVKNLQDAAAFFFKF